MNLCLRIKICYKNINEEQPGSYGHGQLHAVLKAISDFCVKGVNLDDQLALSETPFEEIKFAIPLMISYLGVFLAAETAFAIMAIREYMQDILNLEDSEIVNLN